MEQDAAASRGTVGPGATTAGVPAGTGAPMGDGAVRRPAEGSRSAEASRPAEGHLGDDRGSLCGGGGGAICYGGQESWCGGGGGIWCGGGQPRSRGASRIWCDGRGSCGCSCAVRFLPSTLVTLAACLETTAGQLSFHGLHHGNALLTVFTLLYVDVLATTGTMYYMAVRPVHR
uniref:Uncharacterized protein n=1 Tax=Oryza brachyantha TaxID=4533 RepID=J3LWA6_ORYBR